MSKKRLLWILPVGLLAVPLILLLIVYLLLSTHAGSAWLMHQAAAQAKQQNIQLKYGKFEGTWLDQMTLTDIF